MKKYLLTLNENQMNALGYILRNAHHVPLTNTTGPDTILPRSREILDAMEDAPVFTENTEAGEGCRVVK